MWQDSESGRANGRRASQKELDAIDPEWLSATIGAIYDCALAPDRWPQVLEALGRRFNFYGVVLGIVQLRPDAHGVQVHFGFDEEWFAWGAAHPEEVTQAWGGAAAIEAFPLEEPILALEVKPWAEWQKTRYYREIMGPREMVDGLLIKLSGEPQLMGYLGVSRHASYGLIEPVVVETFRLLAPHFRRAVTISNFFDLKEIEAGTFNAVLEGLTCAVVLVDEDLAVVRANPAADRMLADARVIRPEQGRLTVAGRLAEDALRSAVRMAAENEASIGRRGIGIPAVADDGAASVLHVLPLKRREMRPGLVQRAVAAVFVAPGDASEPVDVIAILYDLTPAEAQICSAVCKGRTLARTAADLGIAKSTARTHLLRVFEKTGCKRQAELAALAARLSPML
jgi:DNA-binding CsgD family transcriptional regulator